MIENIILGLLFFGPVYLYLGKKATEIIFEHSDTTLGVRLIAPVLLVPILIIRVFKILWKLA